MTTDQIVTIGNCPLPQTRKDLVISLGTVQLHSFEMQNSTQLSQYATIERLNNQ